MNLIKTILSIMGTTIETNVYVVIRNTQLKKKTGTLSGIYASEGVTVEADWKWDNGDLFGYRKILSGPFIGYFINDEDIEPFQETPPPEEVAFAVLYETDGSTRRFDEV